MPDGRRADRRDGIAAGEIHAQIPRIGALRAGLNRAAQLLRIDEIRRRLFPQHADQQRLPIRGNQRIGILVRRKRLRRRQAGHEEFMQPQRVGHQRLAQRRSRRPRLREHRLVVRKLRPHSRRRKPPACRGQRCVIQVVDSRRPKLMLDEPHHVRLGAVQHAVAKRLGIGRIGDRLFKALGECQQPVRIGRIMI